MIRDFTPEELSRAYLELLALARCYIGPDGADLHAVADIVNGMEFPGGLYIQGAGRLIAALASRVGDVHEVLDEMTRGVVDLAADGP